MDLTTKIDSLAEYIDIVKNTEDSNKKTYTFGASTYCFRGQSNKCHELIPSVFRENSPAKMLQVNASIVYETNMLKRFKRQSMQYVTNGLAMNWINWMEYAQHFGVPTRLLDWTDNPLVALYFACRCDNNTDGAVYFLDRANYYTYLKTDIIKESIFPTVSNRVNELIENRKELEEYPVLYDPVLSDSRMSVQGSKFMLWGDDKRSFDCISDDIKQLVKDENEHDGTKFVPLSDSFLYKITIPHKIKQFLLHELDVCSINEQTIFPGMDGIGRYIRTKHEESKASIE